MTQVVPALTSDLREALTVGDLRSAQASALAASEIMFDSGNVPGAVTCLAAVLQARADLDLEDEDYLELRAQALGLATRSSDAGWGPGVSLSWLIAAQCACVYARRTDPPAQDVLLAALRDVADILEMVAEHPLDERDSFQVPLLAMLTAAVYEDTRAAQWPVADQLQTRALVRRAGRAAERVLPRGIGARCYDDPERARRLESSLLRLIEENP